MECSSPPCVAVWLWDMGIDCCPDQEIMHLPLAVPTDHDWLQMTEWHQQRDPVQTDQKSPSITVDLQLATD